MSLEYATHEISRLPDHLRNSFLSRVTKSDLPGVAPGARLDTLLWLIPHNSRSLTLVFECDSKNYLHEDISAWLVDPNSGEWFPVCRPFNTELLQIELTLIRMYREDIVLHEVWPASEPNSLHGKNRQPKHVETLRYLPCLEMSRPSDDWDSTSIKRYERWEMCEPTQVPLSSTNDSVDFERSSEGDSLVYKFLSELAATTGAVFSATYVDGGAGNGKIQLNPQNPDCLPLQILICQGTPIDVVIGGFPDIFDEVDVEVKTSDPRFIRDTTPEIRKIFRLSVMWISRGVVEFRHQESHTINISMIGNLELHYKSKLFVKMFVANRIRRNVVSLWKPWVVD